MEKLELKESELQQLKEDLIEGKNLSSVNAVEHYKNNPQRIVYTIIKMCVASNGKEAFPYKEILEEYKKGLEIPEETKWNPIDWFSQILTQIRNDEKTGISEEAEDIFRRWYDIIDRRWSDQTKYIYAITNPEIFKEIKKIFLEVE